MSETDEALLAKYAASCEALIEVGDTDIYGRTLSGPIQVVTPWSALDALYANLPARFPPLYEQLLLSYRWDSVDMGTYQLLGNGPDEDFTPLLTAIQGDKGLYETLAPSGYLKFARGPDIDYDPVCFDFRHRLKDGDCPIVKLDHEAILCHYRIEMTAELASSFRELVNETILRMLTP